MKVVQINITSGIGSTGKIAVAISRLLNERRIENHIIHSGRSNPNNDCISIGLPSVYYKIQALKSRVLGNYGFNSHLSTLIIIKHLRSIRPNIIHLHNIHGHNVNLRMLMNYARKNNISVVWTFHDCWAVTGYCTHFDRIGCQKWKICCANCPQKSRYSWFFDNSNKLFERKKKLLNAIPSLTIVCPSMWMKKKVSESFVSDRSIYVINNGIDLTVFNQNFSILQDNKRNDDRINILAVSFIWDDSKGLDIVSRLSYDLDERFNLVVVGVDEKQKALFSSRTRSVRRTKSQKELAQLYRDADLLINPTREDTFPTVNIEALACGTPVLTFNTGGSPEIIDNNTGYVVEKDDYESFLLYIKGLSKKRESISKQCIERAQYFQEKERFLEYIDLYLNLT